ncbi:hypothetical protein CEN46_15280 [Fischerella thermalis CCMEE 5318]|uniref:Uncharacterized protein n=1 Tax=Fischerella thermalis CCMEE 5318 TaxID=2019666 RepID=A0A2N6LD66_9CYAN|nr:hypothetical protein CEN46_15280 [Fischerella thermalis CCMEE 5318]
MLDTIEYEYEYGTQEHWKISNLGSWSQNQNIMASSLFAEAAVRKYAYDVAQKCNKNQRHW